MRELRVVRADPAGNITLFVLTPVEKAECAAVAGKLLAINLAAATNAALKTKTKTPLRKI